MVEKYCDMTTQRFEIPKMCKLCLWLVYALKKIVQTSIMGMANAMNII